MDIDNKYGHHLTNYKIQVKRYRLPFQAAAALESLEVEHYFAHVYNIYFFLSKDQC